MIGSIDISSRITQATKALADIDSELAWELAGTAADAAGIVDPTPASDLIGAGIALRNGDFLGAGLSIASVLPYVGDAAAKPVKAARAGKRIVELRQAKVIAEKKLADLHALKKQDEAAEIAAKEAKIGEGAKRRPDNEKATADEEKAATRGTADKDCEDCGKTGKPVKVMKKTEVDPCFSPKKLHPSKAKEFREQLQQQEDALNKMTVKEFQDARNFFDTNKRMGTGAAQRDARLEYEKLLIRRLRRKFEKELSPKEAKEKAIEAASEKMKEIAALHEPDMIAGGKDEVKNMGDKRVNSSIGSQWRSRVSSIDQAAAQVPAIDAADTRMNVKLKIC